MSSVTQESGGGKFTPGPWRITKQASEKSEAVCWVQGLTNGVLVAYTILGPSEHTVTTYNAKADADLISAAPDLYAACERFLAQHQAAIDAAQSSAIWVQPFKRCECGPCDDARAALAKAVPQ